MTARPRIRPALLADGAALAALMTELDYPTSASEMRARLATILERSDYRTVVAELGETVVGMAGAMIAPFYEKNGPYVRLVALVVEPAHRSAGIGELLVDEVEAWARAQGASEVVVNSSNHRTEAHRFYERLAYRDTGRRFVKVLV